jgi:hypothetical protein
MDASRLRPDLARLHDRILDGLGRGLSRTASFAAQVARSTRAFRDRTGHARGSVHHGVRGSFFHFIQAGGRDAPYVKWLEEGTDAHVILPRKAAALRFIQAGRFRFAKRVNHPGTRPTHFMQNARDQAESAAHRFFEAELNAVILR